MEGKALHFSFKLYIMALYYDLPVFKDVYKLTLLLYSLTKDFSKEYKYTLGQDLKRDVMVLMRSIYRANKAQNGLAMRSDPKGIAYRCCCVLFYYLSSHRLKAAALSLPITISAECEG